MRQRKVKMTVPLMAVLMGVLLVGSAVMAEQVPLTDNCSLITPAGVTTSMSIEIVKGPNGEFPVYQPAVNSFQWIYNLKGWTLSNSKVSMLLPNCTNPVVGVVFPDPNGASLKFDNAGFPNADINKANFGRWTDHDNVVTWANMNAGVGKFSLNTIQANPLRQTSMQVVGGNNIFWCPGIKGPDCPEFVDPSLAITTDQKMLIDGSTYKIVRHAKSGHILDVQICGSTDPFYGSCGQECCSLPKSDKIGAEFLNQCQSLELNQGQPTCTFLTSGSPHQRTFYYGTLLQRKNCCCTAPVLETVVRNAAGEVIDCLVSGSAHPVDGHVCAPNSCYP